MSDGLNMQARVGEPESELEPGVLAVRSIKAKPVRFLVNATGVVDTSISGPVMLQQPQRWSHDFDPDTNESRASLPAVWPVFDNPPATQTPPEGASDLTIATTEFVDRAVQAGVRQAVMEARRGGDGRFPAGPGELGEYISASAPAPGVELLPSLFQVVTQLEVSAGEWLLTGTTAFGVAGGIGPFNNCFFLTAIAESNTFGGFNQGVTSICAAPYSAGTDMCFPVTTRLLTPATKPMFLLAYTAGLNNPGARIMVYGYFQARRVR